MSFPNDPKGTKQISSLQIPVAVTSTANGSGVDFGACDQSGLLVIHVGAVTGISPTLALKLQESKNDNTLDASGAAEAYADITGATASLTDADASSIITVRVNNRSRKYVRLVKTAGGTSPSFTVGVTFIADKKTF